MIEKTIFRCQQNFSDYLNLHTYDLIHAAETAV